MLALDTNVVVRFLVNDNAVQAKRARALIEKNSLSISPTVLLETEWVLRAAYRFQPADIARFLRALLGLAQIQVRESEAVSEALRCFEAGMDFADALHLSLAGDAEALASFDRALIKTAAKLKTRPVISP